jgi:hypothetical protein
MMVHVDRFAAYTSARSALASIERATTAWPPDLAAIAHATASKVIAKTALAIDKEPRSPERRTCLREALVDALVLASFCDIAAAHGHSSEELDESLRHASRTISMLGMSFHATSSGE